MENQDEHYHAAGSMPKQPEKIKTQQEADEEKGQGKHGLHPSQPEGEMHDRITGEDMKDKDAGEEAGEAAAPVEEPAKEGEEGEGEPEGDPDLPPQD
jgi:hypothetical protein